jgi:hypothetical protein
MIVFRVEHSDGKGPYADRWAWPTREEAPAFIRDIANSHELPGGDPHPSPWDDGLPGGIDNDEFFACHRIDLLLAWFFREGATDARKLAQVGLEVVVYEVRKRDVRKGGRQCVFFRDRAQVVGRWNPMAFFDEFHPGPHVQSALREVR